MKSINLGSSTVEYQVELGKRTSTKVQVHYPGYLVIKAPKGTDASSIESMILKNKDAILRSLEKYASLAEPVRAKSFRDDESFMYLGTPYSLAVSEKPSLSKPEVRIERGVMTVSSPDASSDAVRSAIEKFYARECKLIVKKRIAHYQPRFKQKPKSVDVIDSSEKWGSCNYMKMLSFNWRLSMAPLPVIDYLVVHEMSHMDHMNHSKSFWTSVGKIMPDYKESIRWLEINAQGLLNLTI
jgi:predicted metal-dependent hydrolase